ncbi:MAG: RNA-binding protein [Gammaproteobacteria bacterium]|nr:RNA-binding protein [Gammaproteobacteria bacterium]
MNILIDNFPPDVTEEEVRELLGDNENIEDILLTDGENSKDVSVTVRVNIERAGATGMAEYINGKFFKDRRLSAQVMSLLNE